MAAFFEPSDVTNLTRYPRHDRTDAEQLSQRGWCVSQRLGDACLDVFDAPINRDQVRLAIGGELPTCPPHDVTPPETSPANSRCSRRTVRVRVATNSARRADRNRQAT